MFMRTLATYAIHDWHLGKDCVQVDSADPSVANWGTSS